MANNELREEEIRAATIGEPQLHSGQIELAEYDPVWPQRFEQEAVKIRGALGNRAVRVEHTGSTSVPGLAAKPIIDIVLVVADSSDEASYVPPLEEAGYVLRIREPDWYEHRVLKAPDLSVNLHAFSEGCPEVDRMLLFRDRLRAEPEDRDLYERTKRELAQKEWKYVQNYADAKSAVVEEIVARASFPRGRIDELVERIKGKESPAGMSTKIVAVDGPGAAGKSTLAKRLATELDAQIVHTDDFASWDDPLDWWPRLIADVLEPLSRNETARFRCTNWEGGPEEEREVEPSEFVILEGVSASREAFRPFLTYTIWVETPRHVRLRRGLERDGEASRAKWDEWMAEEDGYAERERPRERADAVVPGVQRVT